MIFFYILIFSLPLHDHWLFSYSIGDLSVVKFLALASVPFAVFRLVTRLLSGGFRVSAIMFWTFAYSMIALVSYYFVQGGSFSLSLEQKHGVAPDADILSMMLFFLLIVCLVDSMTRLYRVLLTMIGSVGITSIYVVRDWMFNRQWADYRPGGVSGDANYFALCAVAALLVALHLVLTNRPRWEKLFLYGCLATTSVAFLMAASRGGILGLGAGLLFLMLRSERGMRSLGVVVLLMIPLVFVVPNTLLQRFSNPGKGDEEAVDHRLITWKAGLRMVATHPIAGVGVGAFEFVVTQYEDLDPGKEPVWNLAHNTYIEVAAELGIPGFLAYFALMTSSFLAWGRFTRPRSLLQDPLLHEISVGFQAAFLSAAVSAFFVSAWWLRFFWLVLFLPACLPAVAQSITAKVPLKPQPELAIAGSTR